MRGKLITETTRLILREFLLNDYHALVDIVRNPRVMKYSLSGPLSLSQTKEKINYFIRCYKQFGFGKWAVVLKRDNQLIGYCGLDIDEIDNKKQIEIGFRFGEEYWGKGYATEAASVAIRYSLTELKLSSIIAIVDPENKASIRVLEKIGMVFIKNTVFHGSPVMVYKIDNATEYHSA